MQGAGGCRDTFCHCLFDTRMQHNSQKLLNACACSLWTFFDLGQKNQKQLIKNKTKKKHANFFGAFNKTQESAVRGVNLSCLNAIFGLCLFFIFCFFKRHGHNKEYVTQKMTLYRRNKKKITLLFPVQNIYIFFQLPID